MIRKILCVSINLLLLLQNSAFALTEQDYRELLKDSEFAAADRELKEAWDYAKNNLTPEAFNDLKESQREWVRSGRDESAVELMDFQGYSKLMAYIAVTNDRVKAIRKMSGQEKAELQAGVIKADKDYITVIAEGRNSDRKSALESAYVDAVRLAVGMIISAKTELNDDGLSEKIITHSRGVIESFEILDEHKEGNLTKLYIQAKVHREILQDETKRYIEAQTVKADARAVVKAQMNEHARETTTQAKQKSGSELLRDVLESYEPENFFSATLNPQIFYNKKTKKPYVQITEKFNKTVFWDEFLPKLRKALDGVAVKKSKHFYDDNVRRANQSLPKTGYLIDGGLTDRSKINYPYRYSLRREDDAHYNIIIPDNVASFTLYEMPFRRLLSHSIRLGEFHELDYSVTENITENITEEGASMLLAFLKFTQRMCRPVVYSITYLNKDKDVISVQVIKINPRAFAVYRSFDNVRYLNPGILSFAPGYVGGIDRHSSGFGQNLFLGTGSYNKTNPEEGYEVELDSDELQRLDSMKFEVVFE